VLSTLLENQHDGVGGRGWLVSRPGRRVHLARERMQVQMSVARHRKWGNGQLDPGPLCSVATVAHGP
jgi:hypothetical protein